MKKTLFHPKSNSEDRFNFQLKILLYELIDLRPIIYIDESGFCVDAPRDRGYSLIGERCYDCKDWHARGRLNAIGAIIDFNFINVCLFDGNINADVFYAWLEQELIPVIPEKSVIVLDNASFHKRSDAIELIQKNGFSIEFLPPYSPDLNPIEKKWAQAKSIRRKFNYSPDELFLHPEL